MYFQSNLATRLAWPVGNVLSSLNHAPHTANLLLVRIMIALLPYHIFETFALFRNRCAASLHRSAAPTNDSVSLGWALVMTHRHSPVNDMFSRVSNSARGLQLFLRLFSGDCCSRVYGKSDLG